MTEDVEHERVAEDVEHESRWGHMAMRKALGEEAFEERFAGAKLVCQCSSIGGLKGKGGKEFLSQLQTSLNSGGGGGGAAGGAGGSSVLRASGTSLVWPTREELRRSTGGYSMGGCRPAQPPHHLTALPYALPCHLP